MSKYYGFYFVENTGIYAGKQFLNIGYGAEYQAADKVWLESGKKNDLFKKIVTKYDLPITKNDVIWVNDETIPTNN
jgi:hypothetical protein